MTAWRRGRDSSASGDGSLGALVEGREYRG